METTSHPVYVIVGGICHTPALFDPLIAELKTHDVEALAVRLPTVGYDTEGTTQDDEIETIREVILDFLDVQNRNVILLCHSYGGWPGSRAIKNLDLTARHKEGKTTAVVEIVFLTAHLVPDGTIASQTVFNPHWLTVKDGVRTANEGCISLLFSDLDADRQRYWFEKLEPHRRNISDDPCFDAPWKSSVKKTYIFATADKASPLERQFAMVKGVEPNETWSFKSIAADHEPFLSKTADLAKLLIAPTY